MAGTEGQADFVWMRSGTPRPDKVHHRAKSTNRPSLSPRKKQEESTVQPSKRSDPLKIHQLTRQ